MSAVLSDCGRYRYRLERDCGMLGTVNGPTAAVIMVNPSTADHAEDDATIRKVRGFTSRYGFGRFVVGNLFAWRATGAISSPGKAGNVRLWALADH